MVTHRHRIKISTAQRVSESFAAQRQRYRPVVDESYLAALSERMAAALGLPLATAARRVREVAVSAGAGQLDAGGDARWWKAPRSKP